MERKSATIFSNCPYEVKSISNLRTIPEHNEEPIIEQIGQKANPPSVLFADESSRGALNKVVLPNFLLRPPFGMPRFKDVITLKRLGNTPQARMAKQIIIDEIVSIPWSIKPRDKSIKEIEPALQAKIDEITNFLLNPNTRGDSLADLFRMELEDELNYDSGIWVKEFDETQTMVEIVAADGRTFLKNPDIHGKYTERADIVPFGAVDLDAESRQNLFGSRDTGLRVETPVGLTIEQAKEKAAYFQFGFISTSRPVPFGRREVVWFEHNPQTDQIYGKSPIESIMEVLQNLKYSIEYNLDYFEDNNVPKGFINLAGSDEDGMEAFRDKWNELQLKTNAEGLLKKNFHRVPITNTEKAEFVTVQFSAQELQLIEQSMWYSKLVWATFGATPSELGFTEDSNLATEMGQSRTFRRKAILPRLERQAFRMNHDILSEWDFGEELVFEYDTFDIEDEKKKWDLYDLQIRTGAITINEIRIKEGLEELEEEDLPGFQEVTEEDLAKLEGNNPKEKDPKEKESLSRAEKKANQVDFNTVQKAMLSILKDKEPELINALRSEAKGDRLTQIKSFSDVIRSIGRILNFDTLKSLISKATENIYNSGVNEVKDLAEKSGIVTQSITANQAQVKFLSDLTFGNIKGMEADLENKLRQAIRMSIVNGEGIGKMASRVKSVFDVSENRAKTIARTESNRVENMGSLQAAKDLETDKIKLKKYLLWTNDSRTSDLTKALHNKYGSEEKAIGLDKNFEIKFNKLNISQQAPPFHPNERDQLITFIINKEE